MHKLFVSKIFSDKEIPIDLFFGEIPKFLIDFQGFTSLKKSGHNFSEVYGLPVTFYA